MPRVDNRSVAIRCFHPSGIVFVVLPLRRVYG